MKIDIFKHKRKLAAGIVIVCLSGTGAYYAVNKTHVKGAELIERLPETSRVEAGDLSKRVTASGTTRAADETSIFIELSQEVGEVFVELGDVVEEGQLLVTYNTGDTKRDLEKKLKEAQITLQNAQLTLNDLAKPAEGTELLDLQSRLISAEESLENAKTELANFDAKIAQAEREAENARKTMENNERLLAVGGVSQSEYDSSRDNYDDALVSLNDTEQSRQTKESSLAALELAVENARLSLEYGQNPMNDPDTASSYARQQNAVTTAQLNVQSAQDELSKITDATYSPISGAIIETNAVEGQMLTDSTVIMKVADLTQIDVDAYVSEYDIASIQVGQRVELTSDGIENKTYTGEVTKIEPVATSQSTISGSETVVPIVVHMLDADELVKPGFSFDLEIITVELEDANYIPISAVFKDDDGQTCVYRIADGQRLQKTAVTLGTYSDMSVELLGGLTAEDEFITTVEDEMTDGALLTDYKTIAGPSAGSGDHQEGSLLDSVMPTGGGMPGGGRMQGGGMPGGGGGRP